jgi:hypothetical protein
VEEQLADGPVRIGVDRGPRFCRDRAAHAPDRRAAAGSAPSAVGPASLPISPDKFARASRMPAQSPTSPAVAAAKLWHPRRLPLARFFAAAGLWPGKNRRRRPTTASYQWVAAIRRRPARNVFSLPRQSAGKWQGSRRVVAI